MLSRLQVKNFVLIDSLEIDFPEGLIIITGQTGAGKSILLGALSLVMGSKADSSMVSEGAENCVVEAEFDIEPDDDRARVMLEENEVEWDEGHLIIRRVVNRSGRSRAFVNDSPVPVTVLQELSSCLIDVHSQHQTLMLSDSRFQLGILDHFAGNAHLLEECSELWSELNSVKSELRNVEARIAQLAGEKDYNEAQFMQLESAALRVGELAELEEEQKQLAHAEEIKTSLGMVEELFASSAGDAPSIDVSLKEAARQLSRVGRFIPAVEELGERVEACRRELDDILSDVSTINSRTELSESRLQEVEDRMSFLYGLMHKHSCVDEAELIALRDRLSETLFDSTALEEKRMFLQDSLKNLTVKLEDVADRLHDSRAASAAAFAASITESIRFMELPLAVFEVSLSECQSGPSGKDSVSFRFSATGRNAVDVSKCASGGEMSRIMLALKAMLARYTKMPTMIFDEIDTGVSGSVADKMGSMICSMGGYMQVFAITHLPQVAAKGSAHYLVSKEIDAATSKAVSGITRLSDDERVLEVARMLSGSVLTDAAVENAKSLLVG